MSLKQRVVSIYWIINLIILFVIIPNKALGLSFNIDTNVNNKYIKLFILAGQSNIVGYKSNIQDLPSSWQIPQKEVLWYSSNNKWVPLQVPTEPLPFSGGVFRRVGFGPEVSLGLKLANSLKETVAIVKYAQNGTNLAEDWQPSGSIYNNMLQRVNNSVTSLIALGYNVDISGFFWLQGESDAKNDLNKAKNYQQNFTNFIKQIRTDFKNSNLPFIYGLIPVVNNQVTAFGAFRYGDIVREAQTKVSETIPFTGTVETIDLSRDFDNLHLNSQGEIGLGARLGDKWVNVHSIPELSAVKSLGFIFDGYKKALDYQNRTKKLEYRIKSYVNSR